MNSLSLDDNVNGEIQKSDNCFWIVSSYCALVYMQEEASNFGIDWNGPPVIENDHENTSTVEVPNVFCPLDPEEMAILHSLFDPLEDTNQDDDMGIELYIATREFVKHCLNYVE